MSSLDEIKERKTAPPEAGPEKRGPGRPKKTAAPQPVADPAAMPPEAVEAMLDSSLQQVVQLPCLVRGWKPLDEQEVTLMVMGCKPLINKYLPDMLGAWGPEILFIAMVLQCYGKRFADERSQDVRDRGHRDGKIVSIQKTDATGGPTDSGGPTM